MLMTDFRETDACPHYLCSVRIKGCFVMVFRSVYIVRGMVASVWTRFTPRIFAENRKRADRGLNQDTYHDIADEKRSSGRGDVP
jgi:hypothetical protein